MGGVQEERVDDPCDEDDAPWDVVPRGVLCLPDLRGDEVAHACASAALIVLRSGMSARRRRLTVSDQQHRVRRRLLGVARVAARAPTQREDEGRGAEAEDVNGEQQDALEVERHRNEQDAAEDAAGQRAVASWYSSGVDGRTGAGSSRSRRRLLRWCTSS